MEKEETVKFSELAHFTPKQMEARAAIPGHKYILYGGAMGGGKSYWLRWQLLELLIRVYAKYGLKGVPAALFCEDYPSLKDRHISKIQYEFPPWLGTMNVSDHNFVLAPEYGSGVLAFRNLDDPSKYQSAEFPFQGVDEITKNGPDVFQFLRTRLRWPGIVNTKFLASTNPGGIGHAWVKKLWIDKIYDPNEQEQELFFYLPARAADNPYLDPSYLKSLEGLPEDMRKAYLEGDWDLFQGQFFKEWRRDIHICEPFNPFERMDAAISTYFIAMDYGYNKPSAVYWMCKTKDDIVYVYRELYRSGLTYEKLMDEIIATTPKAEISKLDYIVADPAIWAKKGEVELSGAEIMQQRWLALLPRTPIQFVKGDNNRVVGWGVLREHLKPLMYNKTKIARLQVMATNHELIRTLPALVHDKTRVEDVDTDGEDHGPDAIRYGLMSNPKNKLAHERTGYMQEKQVQEARQAAKRNNSFR